MAGRIMNTARFPGGGIPEVQSMLYKAAEAIVKGSVLILETTGEVKLAATQPTTGIQGVALEDIASKPGFDMSHDTQVTVRTGNVAEVSVAIANSTTIFSAAAKAGTTPAATHIGEKHDIVLVSGVWQVDLSAAGAAGAIVVDVDLSFSGEEIVFFKFLPSAIVGA